VHREAPVLERARAIIRAALAEGRGFLTATDSKAFLAAFRIPVVLSADAATAEEAVAAAERAGYPVAMKILSPDITHKCDVGGVRLGVPNAGAVRATFAELTESVARTRPDARVSGVSVERMAASPHGRELMVGIARDNVFGPAITFGAGGIAVEVLRSRAIGLPPLTHALIVEMGRGTRVARMLERFRHLPAIDRGALEEVLLRVSEMACELPEVRELDINPLIADERGVLAIDARVVLRAVPAGEPRYAHLAIPPYPVELESVLALPGGESLQLRPIRPEDAELEQRFVEGLSPESRRQRFQSSLSSLSPAMLARFTQIDYDREMALIAIARSGGADVEVGVCRYIQLADGRSCEFAIVVADAWQGRGLGRRMMERLVEVARARGLESMVGWIAAGNEPMLRLCRKLGFRPQEDGDPLTVKLVLDLSAG
jgi:acetyltransferase